MPRPTLSVVIPTRDDYYNAWHTVASLIEHHGHQIDEIVIVDNSPDKSEDAQLLRDQVAGLPGVRYDRIIGPESSCRYKDRGLRLATSAVVICCDSHVQFPTQPVDAIQAVLDWFESHPDSNDLLMGPCGKQPGQVMATQQMLYAWEAEPPGAPPVPKDAEVHAGVVCRGGNLGVWVVDPRGLDPHGAPYEIQQQGTGAFAIRKAAWPGWPATFHGHGGNETHLMESIRQRGGRVLCHPGFRWTHNFGRTHKWTIDGKPSKVPYRMRWQDKASNYLSSARLLDRPQLWDAITAHLAKICPRTLAEQRRLHPRPPGHWDQLVSRWRGSGGDQPTAIPGPLFHELRMRLRPGLRTLEFGTGLSTLLFDANGTDHTALEHNLTWYHRVQEQVTRETTRLIASPLQTGHTGTRWYDWRPSPGEQFDLVLIDGPPGGRAGEPGRDGCRHLLAEILAPAATILIDDTHRDDDRQLATDLAAMYGFRAEFRSVGGRGFAILTRTADARMHEAGVGTELSRILKSRWSIEPEASCGCTGRIREMNYRGITWCAQHVETIVGWLRDGVAHWKTTTGGVTGTWLTLVPAFAETWYLTQLVQEAIAAARAAELSAPTDIAQAA